MSLLIIVSDTAANAVMRAQSLGLTRDDISIVTSLERIHGHKDMLMVYAGQPYLLDDFGEIIEYMTQHNIKAIKWSDPNNTQSP